MPSPSSSLATLRPDLAGSFEEFNMEADRLGFIALRALPPLDVMSQAGTFGKIPIEQLLKVRTTARAPGSNYARGDWTFTTDSYTCSENGSEEPVDDREAKMYANYFDAEQIAARRALDAILRNQEIRTAALLFNTTTYTGASLTTAAGTPWTTVATAVPITNVEAAVVKVYDNTGVWPNCLIISRKTFRTLRNVTQVIDRIAASGAGNPTKASDITVQMLSAVFDLPYILVAGGTKDSATEGQASTPAPIWSSTQAMVCRIAETNDVREPCIGRTFHWSEDGSSIGGTMETYRDEPVRSDVVRARHDTHEKILYTEMGHLLTSL
jgi:hypothetical protein